MALVVASRSRLSLRATDDKSGAFYKRMIWSNTEEAEAAPILPFFSVFIDIKLTVLKQKCT